MDLFNLTLIWLRSKLNDQNVKENNFNDKLCTIFVSTNQQAKHYGNDVT